MSRALVALAALALVSGLEDDVSLLQVAPEAELVHEAAYPHRIAKKGQNAAQNQAKKEDPWRWWWNAVDVLPPDPQFLTECFPGEATVDVQGVGQTPVASLRNGDLVLGNRGYEPVLGFLHTIDAQQSEFVTVVHTDGEFRASAGHLVFVGAESKKVADLEVGEQLGEATVLAIHRATGSLGMHAPLTASGTLAVDGVVASNYAVSSLSQRLPHSVAHSLFFPVRAYHKLGFAAPAKAEAELHPFVDLVYNTMRVDKLVS